MDMGGCKRHVKIRQQACSMPGRPAGKLITLQQHDVLPTGFCQMIGDRGSHGSAADDQGFDMCFHSHPTPLIVSCSPMYPTTIFLHNPADLRTRETDPWAV